MLNPDFQFYLLSNHFGKQLLQCFNKVVHSTWPLGKRWSKMGNGKHTTTCMIVTKLIPGALVSLQLAKKWTSSSGQNRSLILSKYYITHRNCNTKSGFIWLHTKNIIQLIFNDLPQSKTQTQQVTYIHDVCVVYIKCSGHTNAPVYHCNPGTKY